MKVCSAFIKSGDTLYDVDQDAEVKLNKLYVLEGARRWRFPSCMPEIWAQWQRLMNFGPVTAWLRSPHLYFTGNRIFLFLYLQAV